MFFFFIDIDAKINNLSNNISRLAGFSIFSITKRSVHFKPQRLNDCVGSDCVVSVWPVEKIIRTQKVKILFVQYIFLMPSQDATILLSHLVGVGEINRSKGIIP